MTTKPTPREPTQEMIEAGECGDTQWVYYEPDVSGLNSYYWIWQAMWDASPEAQQPPAARGDGGDQEALIAEFWRRVERDPRKRMSEIAGDMVIEHCTRAAAEARAAAIEEAVAWVMENRLPFTVANLRRALSAPATGESQ